jgi:hypothetical protein
MTTLHVFSNRHIKTEIVNVKKGDWIYLEISLSRKRWSLFFKYSHINESKLKITYVTQDEFFKLTGTTDNMKFPFDVIVGNPPFNDDQNQKANTGNYVSASKKLHLEFINKSLELAKQVVMVAPVRGWFVGKNKDKYLARYKKQGLYLIENKGMPFDNAVTGEIGVFHFDKDKEFIRDEFEQNNPLKNSIVDQYKMYTMVGKRNPGELAGTLSTKGKYRVILTSTKIEYTDNDNLFEDKSRGNWRVAFNHNGNKTGKSIYGGKVQVAKPTDYLSLSMSCFVVSSEEEAQNVCNYLMSDEITNLMREIKVSNTNSKYHMSFIPQYVTATE